MPTTLQEQANALGTATRHRIFEYLRTATAPVGVTELTDHFGLHHNAIRQHLQRLVDAELVDRSTAPPAGRGRPRLEYVVTPDAADRWGGVDPYERLSVLLAEVLRTGDAAEVVGHREGAAGITSADARGPVDALVDEMARQGFAPRVHREGDVVELVLGRCPFVSAVLADQATVCGLHLGIARGVADVVGGLAVERLDVVDPREGGCRLVCRTTRPPTT